MVFEFGTYQFATKEAVRTHIRGIVNNAALQVPLKGTAKRCVIALLELHPDADRKIGPGIAEVWVETNAYGKRDSDLPAVRAANQAGRLTR